METGKYMPVLQIISNRLLSVPHKLYSYIVKHNQEGNVRSTEAGHKIKLIGPFVYM